MAYKAINFKTLVNEAALTTPTSSQVYQLGLVIEVQDSAQPNTSKKFMYVKAGAALTQYQPVSINYVDTAGGEVTTAALATQTQPIRFIAVPQVAFTTAYYGFVQIQGHGLAKIDAETYATGDPLRIINAGTTFIVNGTSGTALIDNKTAAISKATGSAAAAISVYLIGNAVQIAAS